MKKTNEASDTDKKVFPSVMNKLKYAEHTLEALDLMDLPKPENAKHVSKSGFRLFAQFVLPIICSGDEQSPYSRLANDLTSVNENNSPGFH